MSKTKGSKQKNSNTAKHMSKVFDAYYECKHLDYLANLINDWELRAGHGPLGMPTIHAIESRQRELLISAMYHNQYAKIENECIDDYFRNLTQWLALASD